jgi:hypothetical protein
LWATSPALFETEGAGRDHPSARECPNLCPDGRQPNMEIEARRGAKLCPSLIETTTSQNVRRFCVRLGSFPERSSVRRVNSASSRQNSPITRDLLHPDVGWGLRNKNMQRKLWRSCGPRLGPDPQIERTRQGPDPRSYRAEAHAMAAVFLCMLILHQVAPHHAGSYQSLDIFSDNQGLVDKIKEMMEWEKLYPSSALLSEWDILSVIMEFIPQLPLPPAVQHVKGHQDKDSPVKSLPLQAQLNCEADVLAREALVAVLTPIPMSPVFPSAVCQLDIADTTVSRKVPASLRFSAAEPAMTEYLRDRNNWDSQTFASVSWPAFSAARFSISNSRFAPKFCHRHRPVGEKANRNDAKYSPCCSCRKDPGLSKMFLENVLILLTNAGLQKVCIWFLEGNGVDGP